MKVAIIGTGNVGSALGSTFVRAGHEIVLAGRDAAKATSVAREVGATAAPSLAEAVRDADAIVLAIPFGALEDVAAAIRETTHGKVVVDAMNPLTPDYSGLATEGGPSAAERLAGLLPDARVVKAFNTLFGSVQANPRLHGEPADVLIATDDEHARTLVAELATTSGFRPVAAGPLNAARQMESLAWLNMRIQMQSQGDWQSAVVFVGAPPAALAA